MQLARDFTIYVHADGRVGRRSIHYYDERTGTKEEIWVDPCMSGRMDDIHQVLTAMMERVPACEQLELPLEGT